MAASKLAMTWEIQSRLNKAENRTRQYSPMQVGMPTTVRDLESAIDEVAGTTSAAVCQTISGLPFWEKLP